MIRLMNINDYHDAYALWTASNGVGLRSLDDSEVGIQKFLCRNPLTNFVYLENNQIKGVILCGHDGRRGYIYHMMVEASLRGQGIGQALLEQAKKALINEGINKVALVVFSENEIGNSFWEKNHFQRREDLYYRNLSLNAKNI